MRLHEALESYFGGFIDLLESYSDLETASVKTELEKSLDDIIFQSLESNMDDDMNDFAASSEEDALQVFEAFSERLVRVVDDAYLPVNISIKRSSQFMHGIKVKPVFRSLVATLAQFIKLLGLKIDEMRVGLGFEETTDAVSSLSRSSSLAVAGSMEGKDSGPASSTTTSTAVADRVMIAKKWNEKLRDSGMYMYIFMYAHGVVPRIHAQNMSSLIMFLLPHTYTYIYTHTCLFQWTNGYRRL